MPFTFSHPAIILPLTRLPNRWFSFTGLIVGTVVPDFEYFFRMDIYSRYSHNLPGLLYFNLPVGILLCFVFHGLVKKDLVANLPVFFRRRSAPVLGLDWPRSFRNNLAVVSLSILIGAASHLFWDGFTHEHGYFVNHLGYRRVSFPVFGKSLFLYSLLQHLSTVAGLFGLYLFAVRMPVSGKYPEGQNSYAYWIFVIMVCGILSAIRLAFSPMGPDAFGKIILTLIAAFLAGMVLAPVCIRRRSPVSRDHRAEPGFSQKR